MGIKFIQKNVTTYIMLKISCQLMCMPNMDERAEIRNEFNPQPEGSPEEYMKREDCKVALRFKL